MISLLTAIVTVVAAPPATKIDCPVAEAKATSGMIDGTGTRGFHALDREPPAEAYLAVARKIDRCAVPIIVPSALTPPVHAGISPSK
jgi:hypothetical protein